MPRMTTGLNDSLKPTIMPGFGNISSSVWAKAKLLAKKAIKVRIRAIVCIFRKSITYSINKCHATEGLIKFFVAKPILLFFADETKHIQLIAVQITEVTGIKAAVSPGPGFAFILCAKLDGLIVQ